MTAVRPSKSSRFIARAPIKICGPSYHASCSADLCNALRKRLAAGDIVSKVGEKAAANPKIASRLN
jgi:hypothetical protein